MCFYIDQQMLIYIRDEGKVRKNKIIKEIEIRLTLFGRRKELVISTFTNFKANRIGRSIVHTTPKVGNKIKKISRLKLVCNNYIGLT